MECLYESETPDENQMPDLHIVEDGDSGFDPGTLGSLTREQIIIIDLTLKNKEAPEIARSRGTQPEQIGLAIENIRGQTGLPLSVLAGMLIEQGMINASPPIEAEAKLPVAEPPTRLTPETEAAIEEDVVITEAEPEPEPEATEDTEIAEPEPPIAREHIQEFLSWMYPREKFEGIGDLSDKQLAAIADAIRAVAKKYDDSLRKPKKRHISPAAIGYTDLWLKGNAIPKIAHITGRNEGSIRLSLAPFAEKLGSYVPSAEVLKAAAES